MNDAGSAAPASTGSAARLFFSIDDVSADFFPDTFARVFQQSALAEGRLIWQGATIAPERITGTALLTIAGESDDISGPGQMQIAHDLRAGIPAERRGHMRVISASLRRPLAAGSSTARQPLHSGEWNLIGRAELESSTKRFLRGI